MDSSKKLVVLYGLNASAPCRSVTLALKHYGVPYEMKVVDLFEKEQLKPEFIKMNIQHTVPTIDDSGFYLHESRAILQYLANKYGKNDSTYPLDPKKRAVIDEMLMFDMGTLSQRYGDYAYTSLNEGLPLSAAKYAKIEEAMDWLSFYIGSNHWVAGCTMTIADFACVATVATMKMCGLDITKWDNVNSWYNRCKQTMTSFVQSNEDGAKDYAKWMRSKFPNMFAH